MQVQFKIICEISLMEIRKSFVVKNIIQIPIFFLFFLSFFKVVNDVKILLPGAR